MHDPPIPDVPSDVTQGCQEPIVVHHDAAVELPLPCCDGVPLRAAQVDGDVLKGQWFLPHTLLAPSSLTCRGPFPQGGGKGSDEFSLPGVILTPRKPPTVGNANRAHTPKGMVYGSLGTNHKALPRAPGMCSGWPHSSSPWRTPMGGSSITVAVGGEGGAAGTTVERGVWCRASREAVWAPPAPGPCSYLCLPRHGGGREGPAGVVPLPAGPQGSAPHARRLRAGSRPHDISSCSHALMCFRPGATPAPGSSLRARDPPPPLCGGA